MAGSEMASLGDGLFSTRRHTGKELWGSPPPEAWAEIESLQAAVEQLQARVQALHQQIQELHG
jgi:hypothetical protein